MKELFCGKGVFCGRAILILACALCAVTGFGETMENYRDFALNHSGSAERGQALFHNEQRLACVKCHTVDGSGSHAGPELANVGAKFPRGELIRAVLEPSARFTSDYATTIVVTQDGEEHQGIIKQATDGFIELMNGDGKPARFERRDIKEQRASPVSLMPEGLETGLSFVEFADLIAYLESLHQPITSEMARRGMPATIPVAPKCAHFPRFFDEKIVFKNPLWFGDVPGTTNVFIVMEHRGTAWSVVRAPGGDSKNVLLDLTNVVSYGPVCGLMGLAFHPKFSENHRYFLKYTAPEGNRINTHIVQRRLSDDGRRDLGESNLVINIPGATQDHEGGCLAFGPDGFLYIGMGDGGPQRDPQGRAQDMGSLSGKVLRIDVDHRDGGKNYSVPRDNPFIGKPGVPPEIWAVGFREPWRFSFDPVTGDLWLGDVGQDTYEEVDIVRAGENYGWNVYEGFAPFSDRYRRDNVTYQPPVFCYPHSTGACITAGFVYHGKAAPQLQGRYICADFQVLKVWAIKQTNRALDSVIEIGRAPDRISSVSQDSGGELYCVGYDSGLVYRIVMADVELPPQL